MASYLQFVTSQTEPVRLLQDVAQDVTQSRSVDVDVVDPLFITLDYMLISSAVAIRSVD